tara:strand:+ start:328 stop:855 length:528 start_codon:yes stop_codon:yes gene_type:complete
MVVHVGVAVVAVAMACSSAYVRQVELRFDEVGDTATFAGHELVFDGLSVVKLPEKSETRVAVIVDGRRLEPAISVFPFGGQTIGTPSTRSTWRDDLQLAVLAVPEAVGDGSSSAAGGGVGAETASSTVVRVTVQPLVSWLWIGGAIMAVGTALAAVAGAGSASSRSRQADREPVA